MSWAVWVIVQSCGCCCAAEAMKVTPRLPHSLVLCVCVCVCVNVFQGVRAQCEKMCATPGSPLGHGNKEDCSCGDLWLSQHCQADPYFPRGLCNRSQNNTPFPKQLWLFPVSQSASQHSLHPILPSTSYYFLPVTHFLLYSQKCRGGLNCLNSVHSPLYL